MNRPTGGRIRCFAIHQNQTFAGTADGSVYLSMDNGASWSSVSNGIPSSAFIECMIVDSIDPSLTYLFAGTRGYGLLVSTDMGGSWQTANNGLTHTFVLSLALHRDGLGNTTMFAGSYNAIFRSTNHGLSWQRTSLPLSNSDEVNAIVVAKNGSQDATIYAGARGVFVSTDDGITWRGTDSTVVDVIGDMQTVEIETGIVGLLVGTTAGILFTSDGGISWHEKNNGLTNKWIAKLTKRGSSIFASTVENSAGEIGVFRTSDQGNSWMAADNGLPERRTEALAAGDSFVFAGTIYSGIYRSSDNGENWNVANNGVTSIGLSCLFVRGSKMFVGTFGNGLAVSTDNGETWDYVWQQPMLFDIFSIVSVGTSLFAGGRGGVIRSTDDGLHWKFAKTGLSNGFVNVLAATDSHLYAGTDEGVFCTTDLAESWNFIGPRSDLNDIYFLTADFSDIFAGRFLGGHIYHSSNYGTSWVAIQHGISLQYWRAFAIDRPRIYAGSTRGAYVSDNGGVSWRPMDNGLMNRSITSFLVRMPVAFAGTDDGIFITEDQGENWRDVSSNLSEIRSRVVAHDSKSVFAMADKSLWRRPISEMSNLVGRLDEPEDYTLEQNFPNPFNSFTTISYYVPAQSHVSLKVFDLLGRELVIIVNRVEGPGYKSVILDGAKFPSGVYFYRLNSGGFILSRKLLVLR